MTRKVEYLKKRNVLLRQEIVRQGLQTLEYQQSLSVTYERFRLEQQQRFAKLQKFAAVGRVTLGLLHDISNPITFTALLAQQQDGKNARLIRRGLREAIAIITSTRRQLIEEPKPRYFYPITEIHHAMTFLHYPMQQRHLVYCLEIEKNVKLFGNAYMFYQCASNLLSNAIEAYPLQRKVIKRKGIRIKLKQQIDKVVFEVEDSGQGIPLKHQCNIFRPLFTTKKPSEGTGIGLAQTKEMIEQSFKGSITFHSIEGVGTTFTIHLPCNP